MNYFKDNYYLPKKYSIFTGAGKNGVLNCNLIYSFYFIGINLRKNRKGSDIQWCYFRTSFTQMTMFYWTLKVRTPTSLTFLVSTDGVFLSKNMIIAIYPQTPSILLCILLI